MGSDGFALDGYATFAYDAAYAVAHALHQVHYVQGRPAANGTALRDALLHAEFEGLTGNVSFNRERGHKMGDRLGALYLLKRFSSNAWRDLATVEPWDNGGFAWRDAPSCEPTSTPGSSGACKRGNIDAAGNLIRDGIDRCTSPQMQGHLSNQIFFTAPVHEATCKRLKDKMSYLMLSFNYHPEDLNPLWQF